MVTVSAHRVLSQTDEEVNERMRTAPVKGMSRPMLKWLGTTLPWSWLGGRRDRVNVAGIGR